MNNSKLYHKTPSTFELPSFVDMQHNVVTVAAGNLPTIDWPDGTWCFPANVYMLTLFNRGLSIGTLLTYATNISPFLRYVFHNKINLADISDNEFTLFIKLIQAEKRQHEPEKFARNANAVIAIGRNCLDFLSCISHLYDDKDFIGPKGQIKAEQKDFLIKQPGSKKDSGKLLRKYWHHRSFPTPDPKHKRLPISSNNVERLRQITQSASSSIYQRKRRYVMLKLLEITGGRRSEVAALRCDSVYAASHMQEPMLKIQTVKKGGNTIVYRYIPIARHDIEFLVEFIEKNRRRVIRTTCGRDNDDGYLLISETQGTKLKSNTITQEIATLAIAAGIKEKSCPHMFRHRFITKLFVALIEQHNFENTDSFRKALLETEKIKQIVQQWTGHANISSLDIYIDMAFEEITNFKKTYNLVNTKLVLNSFQGTLSQLSVELSNGTSPQEITSKLEKLIIALEQDLEQNQH